MLTSFKRIPDTNSFNVTFDDGFEGTVTTQTLREKCPCASCSGEEVLFHKYVPSPKILTEDSFILEKAQPSGNYALQLFWKDGHNTGIYRWEYLKELCTPLR
jgi:DUF971 family protein